MVVVAHKTIGMNVHLKGFVKLAQQIEKHTTMIVTVEYILIPYPTVHDVVVGAGITYAERT
jgi:hypothetical protein